MYKGLNTFPVKNFYLLKAFFNPITQFCYCFKTFERTVAALYISR